MNPFTWQRDLAAELGVPFRDFLLMTVHVPMGIGAAERGRLSRFAVEQCRDGQGGFHVCNRTACDRPGVALHSENGGYYCPRCTRTINEYAGFELIQYPPLTSEDE